MNPFGVSFRLGLATIGVVGALFVWASPVIAATTAESGLEELWQQYPLEPEEGSSVGANPGADIPAAPAERAPRIQSGQGDDAGAGSWEAWQLTLGLAAVAMLLAGGTLALLDTFGSGVILRLPLREGRGPWNLRPSAPAAPTPVAVPPSRSVLESLLRAASASMPESPPQVLGIAATSERPAEPPASPRVAPATGASPKSSAGRADSLKEKLTQAESNLLKEKLAVKPRHATRAKKEAAPVVEGKPDEKRAVLHSVPRPTEGRTRKSGPARQMAAPHVTRTCEVRWWRGYVKSEFFVVETTSAGVERTIARSSAFRWRKREAPAETPEAAAALSALVDQLQDVGWTPTGRGENWFNVKLQSSGAVDLLEGSPRHG